MDYTSRGGFPYFRRKVNGTFVTGRIPGYNTPNDLFPGLYWAEDNCINYDMRSCLARFFNGSTSNDVLIFSVGMTYALKTRKEEIEFESTGKNDNPFIDVRAWLISSIVNFRCNKL
jgi:hypothetical protein